MNRFLSIILLGLFLQTTWAQSGSGYDPENPHDPGMDHQLVLLASPETGGKLSPSSGLQYPQGTQINCSAVANPGYLFVAWKIGETTVSANKDFTYTMPNTDVTLTATFEWKGSEIYDPENPADPAAEGYQHNVTLYASPSNAGYFNSSSFQLTEGKSIEVYAYANTNYRFVSWKQNGQIVSTNNPLTVTMGKSDLAYTAQFTYDPQSPTNPGANNFNLATGELIMDDFEAGNLSNAIKSVIGEDSYLLVNSLMVAGQMQASDFGFANQMTNCTQIDLAKTSGYTEIPAYAFQSITALTKVILPSCISNIGYLAFNGCINLSEINCYALTPPTIDSSLFDSIPAGLLVRVPSSAIDLYKADKDWSAFTILPLESEATTITVNLPKDAADGRYANMTLELNNITNGQVLRMLLSDKTSYTFSNLVQSTKYNIYVKNSRSSILGSILDVALDKAQISVEFKSLLQPQTVQLVVLDSANKDVTDQVSVVWTDESGNYISDGESIEGFIEKDIVNYAIKLSDDLALTYVAPQKQNYVVNDTSNLITYRLNPYKKITITGKVQDATTGKYIQNAAVTISQNINGTQSTSLILKTDSAGKFSALIYDAAASVNVSSNKYIDYTAEYTNLYDGQDLGCLELERVEGRIIDLTFTHSDNIEEGQQRIIQTGYDDYTNISYALYDKTNHKSISDFIVQGTTIVVTEDIPNDIQLVITATSKSNAFSPVSTECILKSVGRSSATCNILNWGEVQSDYVYSNNTKTVLLVYNDKNVLVDNITCQNNQATIKDLQDGNYTIVAMGSNEYFNTILNLDEFEEIGLKEGIDYVSKSVEVYSGYISKVSFSVIPEFVLAKFYYTGSNTQFTVNKQSVTIGNYLTLRAVIDFKSEYADDISNVKLRVDLPEHCTLVSNSVLLGEGYGSYTVAGQQVTIDLPSLNDNIRFCVSPTKEGEYSANAFVVFDKGGKTIVQPFGSAKFKARSLIISVPEKTASSTVIVKGVASADSEVSIFDNDVLVGKTTAMANGKWEAKIELYKPFAKSFHTIYAKVASSGGTTLLTDNKILEYDQNYSIPSKITMLYNNKTITMDLLQRRNSSNSYSYLPTQTDFTFTAEFTQSDTALIKNLDFLVLLSDGTNRRLTSKFNASKGIWIAKSKFTDIKRLPINIKVIYNQTSVTNPYTNEMQSETDDAYNVTYNELLDAYDNGEVSVITETDTSIVFSITPNGYSSPEYFNVHIGNYQELLQGYSRDSLYHIVNDTANYYLAQQIGETYYSLVVFNNLSQEAVVIKYTGTKSMVKSTKMRKTLPMAAYASSGLWFAGLEDYWNLPEVNNWYQTMSMESNSIQKIDEDISYLLNATCEDGTYKLNNPDFIASYKQQQQEWNTSAQKFVQNLTKMVDIEKQSLRDKCTLNGASSIGLSMAGIAVKGLSQLVEQGSPVLSNLSEKTFGFVSSSLIPAATIASSEVKAKEIGYILGGSVDATYPKKDITSWYCMQSQKHSQWATRIITGIKSGYMDCDNDEAGDDEERFPNDELQPIIDPSGYVYEGVSSNRLEGVMTTCYYKEQVEDMFGDIKETVVKWDATPYDQENPLFTDKEGRYAWDVPQGLWQVKYEKEGYETTYSEWLPVPPPQLEINVGLVQNSQPVVVEAHAYENGIELTFDKYMMPSTLTDENIKVSQDDQYIEGQIELIDEEVAYKDETVKYASRVRFVPNTSFLGNKEVTLVVSNHVKSYAGIKMAEAFMQNFDIEKEIKSIVADSLVDVPYDDTEVVTLHLLPYDAGDGKTVHAEVASDMILSLNEEDVVADANGVAEFTIKGELPGSTNITFSIEGAAVTATTVANVEEKPIVSSPVASMVTGTLVQRGTTISLFCPTTGSSIYYTLDGTSPSGESSSCKLYDGTPIVINDTTTIRAVAKASGMTDSEVAVFTYYVCNVTITVVGENGTVTGGGIYDYCSVVTLTATPNEHYHFVRWSDGETNASRTITATEDVTYTAIFAIDRFVLTVTSSDIQKGTVSGGGTYDYDTKVILTANAVSGYKFTNWTDNNADNPRTVNVTDDAQYMAVFAPNIIKDINLTPYEGMYDAQSHGITVNGTLPGDVITYSTDGNQWIADMPTFTNACNAKVYVKVTRAGYQDTIASSTISITKRHVTLTSKSQNKYYDGTPLTNDTIVVSGDGFVGLDGATYIVTGTQTEVGSSANTFTYSLNEETGTIANNYDIVKVEGTLTVIKAEGIDICLAEIGTISNETYSGFAYTPSLTVTYNSEVLKDSIDYMVIYTNNTDAGTATATLVGIGTYKGITSANFTILQRQVTLTSATAAKIYDGTPLVKDSIVVSGDGFVGTENVFCCANGAQKNVGTSKNTFTYMYIDGAKAQNYVVSTIEGDLTVTARQLEVSGTTIQDKIYDGSTVATNEIGEISGLIVGDNVKVTAISNFDTKDAGQNKVVTVTYKLDNSSAAKNYMAPVNDTLTASIKSRQLTIIGTTVDGKLYDGSTLATAVIGSLKGVVDSDTSFISVSATAAFMSKDVAKNKPVKVDYVLNDTLSSSNYLAPVSDTLWATISPVSVTISGTAVESTKVYDGTTVIKVTANGQLHGVVGQDNVSLTATAEYTNKKVGDDKMVIVFYEFDGDDKDNYTLPTTATLTASITPIALTINGTTIADKVYDGTVDCSVTNVGELLGLISGDLVTVDTKATFNSKNAGQNKEVSIVYTLNGTDATNYLKPNDTTMMASIEKVPLSITGTQVQSDKVYDGNDNIAITQTGIISNLVQGDDVTFTVVAHYDNIHVGVNNVIVSYTYSGADRDNYLTMDTIRLTASITPKQLTISGTSIATTKEYDGTAVAEVTAVGITEGVLEGDKVIVSATATYDDSNVGKAKPVTVIYTLSGASADDYYAPEPIILYADITAPQTSVDDVNANAHIYVIGHELYVEGLTGEYTIYSTTGQLIYTGDAAQYTLPQTGNYLVRYQGGAVKVQAKH